MIIYLSGIKTAKYILEDLRKPPDVLVTYLEKYIPPINLVNKIFLDCGAYSAFTKDKTINLKDYIDYCHLHKDNFETIAGLDVIGDWKQSSKNYTDMKKEGLTFLPTYHVGEPFDFLDNLLADYDYIGIGGLVPYMPMDKKTIYRKSLMKFLIHTHKKIIGTKKKLHGFGVTSWDFMTNFPWYSVDSTTWLMGQRFARPLFFVNGKLGSATDYKIAANFSNKLGLNLSPSDIKPGLTGTTKDKYYNITMLNIEVMMYAAKVITNLHNRRITKHD